MDIAAARLGTDPLELRRRNFIAPAEMPYDVGGAALSQHTVYDCGDYASALDHALEAIGYEAARAEQADARRQGRHVGIGVASMVEKAGLGPWEYARVEVDATGHVVVYSGVASVGQGIETTLAQVCADELNVSPESITVVHGDSARVPFRHRGLREPRRVGRAAGGAGGRAEGPREDRARGGQSPRGRRRGPRARGRRRARARRAGPKADVPRACAGRRPWSARHGAGTLRRALLRGAEDDVPLWDPRGEVDADTGVVKILRYAIAWDVGKAVNPMIVDGQLVGALAQGIGGALLEEIVYDEAGQLLTGSLMDYLLPTAMDMPEATEVRALEETPTPLNLLGVKGVGEGGSSACGGAIANAVADALAPLGVAITELPLSPGRLSALIRAPAQKRS